MPAQERQGCVLRYPGENSGVKYDFPIKNSKDGPAKLQTWICHPALSHVACPSEQQGFTRLMMNDSPGHGWGDQLMCDIF